MKRVRAWLVRGLAAVGAFAIAAWIYALVTPEPADVLPDRTSSDPFAPPGSAAFVAAVSAHLNEPVSGGNRLELLVNGDEIFPPMLDAIRGARESVTLLTYVYWTGAIAERFADELAAAARRGVEVRVLLDAYGAKEMRPELAARMERSGCRVAWFHPLRWYTLRRFNNRTHRKILVVDGRTGFTGGVGIAREWTGDAQDPEHWRDDHVRVEGPAVRALQGAFSENWRQATGEVLAGESHFPDLEAAGPAPVLAVASEADETISEVAFLYWTALRAARQRVLLSTPYFVPGPELHGELARTARRGVDVRILVPGEHNDQPLARRAGRALYAPLLEAGVRIFEYRPTMMHAKALVADRGWALVGSANFDNRSFDLNYELTLGTSDSAFVERLAGTVEEDLARADEITLDRLRNRPLHDHVLDRLALLLREQL
jgi:cardiolipin synthase